MNRVPERDARMNRSRSIPQISIYADLDPTDKDRVRYVDVISVDTRRVPLRVDTSVPSLILATDRVWSPIVYRSLADPATRPRLTTCRH